jgi:succinoglycan biosynthesis transport protein ExoP
MAQLPDPGSDRLPAIQHERSASPSTYTEIPYGPTDSSAEAGSGGLIEYWRILSRRKGTLILLAIAGALVGFLVTTPQRKIYQAHTTIEMLGVNENFLNQKQVNPTNETGASGDTTDIQTQIRILQSESLLDRVLAKLKTAGPLAAESTKAPVWRTMLNLPSAEPSDEQQQALAMAVDTLKVRNAGQTRIIEVTVDSLSGKIAADFANTLAAEYIEQHLESHFRSTEKTGEWLAKQLDEMRIKLERSEDALQQYARHAGLVYSSDEKTNVSEQKLSQVQVSLSAAQADRIAKQSRWEIAMSSSPEALPDILNDAALQTYQSKLTELTREMAELRATYTPENIKVKRIQAQIGPIQAAADQARSAILKRIKNDYDEALRREKLLAADYGAQRGIVSGEGEKSIQYNILKREADSNRQLYDSMLQQMKAATLSSALQASNIRVIDPAKAPSLPYKPSIPYSAGIGFLGGGFLAVALVVMQERANRTIQEPGETAFYTNLPELGIVPSNEMGSRVWRLNGKNGAAANASPIASSSSLERVELVTWQKKPSMVAESFRATLVSILFSGTNGSRPRVMLVTSCNPAEGKSTVVSNLAIAVAEVNQKVLLIDADLRKPRLHDIFGLKNDRGLSDFLRNKPEKSDETPGVPAHLSADTSAVSLDGMIQETDIPDVYVLTSGPSTAAASSLLFSSRMPELLRTLRTQFETILIDTPPMLQLPDARVLGKIVDKVILVVRAGKTTRDAALAACQRFSEDGTPVLGTILNDWNPKRSPNGYYGYSGGYYYGGYKNGYYGPKKSQD